MDKSKWRRPWVSWVTGLSLLLLAFGLGWLSLRFVLSHVAGPPLTATKQQRGPRTEKAEVVGGVASVRAMLGEEWLLSWQVANIGESSWTVDEYRFVPDHSDQGVLPLMGKVSPGMTVTVLAPIRVPPGSGVREYAWSLTGPHGPVPGGRISAALSGSGP